jgi:heterodisulfide reductase subunit C2
MPIHEKSLIRPENITTQEGLVIDGIDVSGHWSTFITSRVVTDYNENLQEEIAALPGGENIHRCWQCGSCTNACTVNALNPDFNPRYWIYLIRMGLESELLRDKDIIWQCVSCNKCTNICPRDVVPEGVMKATAHWLELKGHTPVCASTHFDEAFMEQISVTGRIEEGKTMRILFKRSGRSLFEDWLVEMVKRLTLKLPFKMMFSMGIEAIFPPRAGNWKKAGKALDEYVAEKRAGHHKALGLAELVEMAKAEVRPGPHHAAE